MTIPISSSVVKIESLQGTSVKTISLEEQQRLVNFFAQQIIENSDYGENSENIIGNCRTSYNLSLEEKKTWASKLRQEAAKFLSVEDGQWKMSVFEHLMKQLQHHQHRIIHYLTSYKDFRLYSTGSLLTDVQREVISYKAESLGNHYLAAILRSAYEQLKSLQENTLKKDSIIKQKITAKQNEDEVSSGSSSPLELPSRKRLSKQQKAVLHQWLVNNWHHPYPTDEEKEKLAKDCGISVKRVNHWYINARVRIWRPITNEAARKAASTGSTSAVADLLRNCKPDNVFKKYLTGGSPSTYDFFGMY
mmetsp:Transcript_22285/g.29146  ORF Transcript_22285/g.29146 Transcript_22285/m.29146 type:complete len:305 (-) Transcript_22285:32-946(-)